MKHDAAKILTAADDDDSLVRAVREGDRRAFELLMRRFNRRLFRLAWATLRDEADAKDALQEAYLNAYRSMKGFRGESALSTWLSRLVLNECLGRRRRNLRRENVIPMVSAEAHMTAVSAVTDSSEPPDEAFGREQMRGLLERKVSELPETFRVVFVLRSVEELSVEETAQILDIPEETVRTRHFRARSLLRESLARDADLAERDLFGFDGPRCDSVVANVLARLQSGDSDSPGQYSSPACYSHEFEE